MATEVQKSQRRKRESAPEFKARRNLRRQQRVQNDPAFAQREIDRDRARRADPAKADRLRASARKYQKKRWREDTEFRAKKAATDKERLSRSSKKYAEKTRDAYNSDEGFRERKLAQLREYRKLPRVREQRSQSNKRRMEKSEAREIARTAGRNYRARLRAAEGTHSPSDISALLAEQSFRCVYCEADLKVVKTHIDHIVPLAKGGSNWPSNLQALCADCNQRKRDADPTDFGRRLGMER